VIRPVVRFGALLGDLPENILRFSVGFLKNTSKSFTCWT